MKVEIETEFEIGTRVKTALWGDGVITEMRCEAVISNGGIQTLLWYYRIKNERGRIIPLMRSEFEPIVETAGL